MIGIVIVAHGALAAEYLKAIEHVVGLQRGMCAITIEADHNRTEKEAEICRAADAVDVVFGHVGQVVVINVLDLWDVEAARRHIGRHQNLDLAGLEFGDRAVALAL